MDLMQKMGGRKFLLALLSILGAAALEVYTTKGLTPTYASLLVALVSSFSLANITATKEFLKTKTGSKQEGLEELNQKVDDLTEIAKSANNPEAVQQLVTLLTVLNAGIADVKTVTSQVGQAVINIQRSIKGN